MEPKLIKGIIRHIEFEELEKMIRRVPLKGKDESNNEIFVYKNASINLRKDINPMEVNPSTFYLIKSNMDKQRLIRDELMAIRYDSLHLDCAIEILNNENKVCTLMPPVIEVTPRVVTYIPREGEIAYASSYTIQIPIINDGAHRVYMALESNETFNAIWISGADQSYPFYALPNEWEKVRIVDSVPSTKEEKKLYVLPNVYHLYRDFGIIGVGEPRGLGGKHG